MGFYVRADGSIRPSRTAYEILESEYGYTNAANMPYLFLRYPQVSSCTTLTLWLSTGDLIGAHFTKADDADHVDRLLNAMDARRGGLAVTRILLAGALQQIGSGWRSSPRYASAGAIKGVLTAKFKSQAYWIYDQDEGVAPKQGAVLPTFDYRVFRGAEDLWQLAQGGEFQIVEQLMA